MKIDPQRPRSAHTIPPLRLDLGTDCARARWRHHVPPRLSHAQGPCACDYVLGFFRRPPCRPQSVPRDLSNNARARPFFTGTGCPPSSTRDERRLHTEPAVDPIATMLSGSRRYVGRECSGRGEVDGPRLIRSDRMVAMPCVAIVIRGRLGMLEYFIIVYRIECVTRGRQGTSGPSRPVHRVRSRFTVL